MQLSRSWRCFPRPATGKRLRFKFSRCGSGHSKKAGASTETKKDTILPWSIVSSHFHQSIGFDWYSIVLLCYHSFRSNVKREFENSPGGEELQLCKRPDGLLILVAFWCKISPFQRFLFSKSWLMQTFFIKTPPTLRLLLLLTATVSEKLEIVLAIFPKKK